MSLRRDAFAVVVHFRDTTLVAELSPRRGVVVLDPPSEPDSEAEPLPAVLAEVEAVRDERVLVLRFRRVRGRKPNPVLILELATNRRNAILAEGTELRVRKRLRVVKGRALRIGQPWAAPGEGPSARVRGEPDVAGWEGLIEGLDEAGARAWLVRSDPLGGQVDCIHLGAAEQRRQNRPAGRSPRAALLAQVAYTSGLNVGVLLDASTPGDGFRRWRRMVEGAEVAPHLLRLGFGPQPYPWPLPGSGAEPVASLLEGMARVGEDAADHRGTGTTGSGEAARYLASRSRRLKRKLKSLQVQLEKTAAASRLREEAALILSSLHLIEPGGTRVTLRGFDGCEHIIDIDPQCKPQEHANALFRRASRLERGEATLPRHIRATEDELARITALRERNRHGDLSSEELDALTPAKPERPRSRSGSRTPPYRTYTSSGGLEIRVGRGARHNDDLTFHHSRPGDIWLHARHAAGAHVILRWTRPERPPATDLHEAAVLAANHSDARGSGTVPVDWTRRKWVRKPRGAVPGAVIPDRVQTVFVAPDPSLAERLGG